MKYIRTNINLTPKHHKTLEALAEIRFPESVGNPNKIERAKASVLRQMLDEYWFAVSGGKLKV